VSWILIAAAAIAMLLTAIGIVVYLVLLDAFPPEPTEG
jgi:hypothetical protein